MWCRAALALYGHQMSGILKHKIHFFTAVGTPVKTASGSFGNVTDILYHHTFPGKTNDGMPEQLVVFTDGQQLMQQPRVTQIDTWGFGKTFTDIDEIRWQYTDDICCLKDVDVMAYGRRALPHSCRKLGAVEHSPVFVSQHRQQPQHSGGGNIKAELRDVMLYIRAQIVLTPHCTCLIISSKITVGVTTAQPETLLVIIGVCCHLIHAERSQVDDSHTSCQRFRSVLQQGARSRTKQDESSLATVGINLRA